jgi:hypothetical protein
MVLIRTDFTKFPFRSEDVTTKRSDQEEKRRVDG